MLKIAVLVSGGGTNLQAIIDAIDNGSVTNAKITAVISNNKNAFSLERARRHNISSYCLSPKDYASRELFNQALLLQLNELAPDLIVLAGFLVVVPEIIINQYENRIINIHPSLIPSFCGKGYYGLKVHEGVLARGVKYTGATVHFVDNGTDTGPIILQKTVEVREDDTTKVLQQRVMEEAEWVILPQAIHLIANQEIEVQGGKVVSKEKSSLFRRKCQMKVLIVGGGGREHAIAYKVSQSPKVDKIYCAPGNAGIESIAECINIDATDIEGLTAFAKQEAIDLTIIGMDDPLVAGIVDAFQAQGLRVFGPRKKAAMIEGSKAFSKDLMKKYNIPSASYETFSDADSALLYLNTANYPIVLKADGLALGKGVLICNTKEEAQDGVKALMLDKQFGSAGDRIVAEEFMTGREVSVLAFCDGKTIRCMTSAQDHKRAKDFDQGLNTGGMGTFSPSPFYTKEVEDFCNQYVYQPTMDAMAAEGRSFVGILFTGLMLTPEGPKVLEYNARFGDPEAQVVIPRMKNDIVDVFEACIDGRLDEIELEFEDNAAVCVVLASQGYPLNYDKGIPITGFENFEDKEGYYCFHAGTKFDGDTIVTNGGRVLGITAKGKDLKEARANAYAACEWVDFANKYKRNDIGKAIDEA